MRLAAKLINFLNAVSLAFLFHWLAMPLSVLYKPLVNKVVGASPIDTGDLIFKAIPV